MYGYCLLHIPIPFSSFYPFPRFFTYFPPEVPLCPRWIEFLELDGTGPPRALYFCIFLYQVKKKKKKKKKEFLENRVCRTFPLMIGPSHNGYKPIKIDATRRE